MLIIATRQISDRIMLAKINRDCFLLEKGPLEKVLAQQFFQLLPVFDVSFMPS